MEQSNNYRISEKVMYKIYFYSFHTAVFLALFFGLSILVNFVHSNIKLTFCNAISFAFSFLFFLNSTQVRIWTKKREVTKFM